MTRRFRPLPALALATLVSGLASAAAADAPDPHRMAFLLEYVGTDYAGTVRDGAVTNEVEYGESLRFARTLVSDYAALPRHSKRVLDGLRTLEARIVAHAPPDEVFALARRLGPKLERSAGRAATPARLPNLANGRRLWAADCALCHGVDGGGDGWAASGMKPPPTAFRGEWLARLTPRQVYHAITFGVDGTAMPSFAWAYDDAQRWDVAFFAMTLRVGFTPTRPAAGERFSLAELAGTSNADLLHRLRRTRAGATEEQVDWFRLNFVAPEGVAPLAGGGAAGAPGLASALQLQDTFAAVADRVFPRVVGVSSWVRDPAWTDQALRAQHGDGWIAANADELRYPGFRRVQRGSGLLIDDEGFVVSCAHLVRDASGETLPLVEIELQDDLRMVTSIVGAEPMLDLAVLRVAGEPPTPPPPPLEFGDSDRLQAGHWLIALGDPPGPERIFTVGLVAMAPQRQCYQAAMSATHVQTSLAIPAGALGGPVVDILGQVVGLGVEDTPPTNAALAAATAPPAGASTGGVLPINLVLNLVEALKVAQSKRSPWIGISVLELPRWRQRLPPGEHPPAPRTGVYIDDVFTPSPASRAGVRPGDFLVGLGGHRVVSVGDFQTWLYVEGIGRTTALDLVRDGQPMTISVPIEQRPPAAVTH